MESEAPIETTTTFSISPTSFPQFPNPQTRNSKSEALEKLLQSYEKTQWPPTGRSEERVTMEKAAVAEASSTHLRVNAPAVYVGSKVGKKRSRASRKAPTTVLSTDAWNFRAMVQHFTGFPQSSSSSSSSFQGPLLAPTASHLAFHNTPPIPPARYSSFLFHHDFNPSPLFFPRPAPPPLRQTALMEDASLNPAASVVLSSERRPTGYGYLN